MILFPNENRTGGTSKTEKSGQGRGLRRYRFKGLVTNSHNLRKKNGHPEIHQFNDETGFCRRTRSSRTTRPLIEASRLLATEALFWFLLANAVSNK